MRLTKIVMLLAIVARPWLAQADYATTFLPQLIKNAELIVAGRIVQLSEDGYKFKITSTLKGTPKDSVITIGRFKDWTCAVRFTEYKAGQEQLVFLSNGFNGQYTILGAGNEGEMPMSGNTVYYIAPDTAIVPKEMVRVHDENVHAVEFSLSSFIEAVQYAVKHDISIFADKPKKLSGPISKNLVLQQIIAEQW